MPRQPDLPLDVLSREVHRLAPSRVRPAVSRPADGVSSQIYRVSSGDHVFYLLVGDTRDEDLTILAETLQRAGRLGASVPEVVAVERRTPELDRSLLLMTEIPGEPLSEVRDPELARHAARRAGRDAALLNSLAVDGFGWIDWTTPSWPPKGPVSRYADFAHEFIPADLGERHALLDGLFGEHELDALDDVIASQATRRLGHGTLSHGDLDVTAIYVHEGEYSGLIDFGELRGGEPEFDRAHFLLHDQETNPVRLSDAFLEGHAEVSGSTAPMALLRQVAILVGLRQLCRAEARGVPRSFLTQFRVAQLLNLLEGRPACEPRADGR